MSSCSSSHSHYASSQASSDTAPSTIASHYDDEEQWASIQHQTGDLVRRLLNDKRESGTMLRAWSVRCQTLEEEVERLARLVTKLEKEKEVAKEQVQVPVATKGEAPHHERSSSSSSSGSTPCKWKGHEWRPVTASTSTPVPLPRPAASQIDPSKSMSKQDPPPCNSFYLVDGCSVPRCKFSHLYELTPTQLEEMRRGAKFHLCNALKNGLECTDPTCCYGHSCPRGSACGRSNRSFSDEQHHAPASPPAQSRPALRRR